MKLLLIALLVSTLVVPAQAEEEIDPSILIPQLRAENALLKVALAKSREESVTYFANSVALRNKFESAVQRINEANDVATQWRTQATLLKRELVYTQAIARHNAARDTCEATPNNQEVPKFRVSNILKEANFFTPRDGVAPTYIAAR